MDRDQTLATAKVYGISRKPDLDGACARADGGREGVAWLRFCLVGFQLRIGSCFLLKPCQRGQENGSSREADAICAL
jgi:hypothetical protein